MVFAYTKLGKLAQLKKAAFLEKLLATKIPGTNMRKAFRSMGLLLRKANFCFVAGTLVRTLAGLLPIEQVRAGMYVWSRDEETGATGWKRVVQTFTTHPSVIHHLTYELRGPPESSASVPLAGEDEGSADTPVRNVRSETLGTTAPHPYFVRNREKSGFVMAEDLREGDELFLSGHRQAVVVSNTTENAPAGETFTTYNFEVEDYHTYFVGRSGVWVHNFSSKFCNELVEHLDLTRKKMGIPDGASLDGKKFDILEEGYASWARSGKPINSKDANFAMHVTGVEELEAYASRFPNGSANNPVEDIASYTKQDRIRKTFDAPKSYHYEIHHLSERRVSRALAIPEKSPDGSIDIWNTSPSINLPERLGGAGFDDSDMQHYLEKYGHKPVFHQGEDGIAGAIEKIFTDMNMPHDGSIAFTPTQKQELVVRLCHLYTHDGRYSHLQAWPATRDWLRRHVQGVSIPDSVPTVLDF
ncbi:MAG: polymorphic toxin-type HINT domain-containing protein [Verrucomicrobiaceae bacterium]